MTNIENTGDLYNEEPIYRYEVILKSSLGESTESSFESDEFIIYPEFNGAWTYPLAGQKFTIRHLEDRLDAFIIISNDTSEYAMSQKCNNLLKAVEAAQRKVEFDNTNETYRSALEKAKKNAEACN